MNLPLSFRLCLLLSGAAIFCDESRINHHSDELEAMIHRMMECHHLPGLAVSVVHGGNVWAKGFGEAVIGNVPFSPDTKVPIGTLADSFTTLLLEIIMSQSSRRKAAWNTPLKHILTDIQYTDSFFYAALNLEDLAAGRSGLSSLPLLWKAEALPDTLNRSGLVSNFVKIQKLRLGFVFRDHFVSNHFTHGLMGRATEVIGNGTWKQLMQDKLLSVLQMNDTGFLGDPQTSIRPDHRFALPYAYCPGCPSFIRTRFTVDTPLSKYRLPVVYPGNGMVSSAKDMTTFLRVFLRNARGEAGPNLFRSRTFLQRMTSVRRSAPGVVNFKKPRSPATHTTFSYGLGWYLGQYNGYDVAWNAGKLHNYLTFTAVVKDLDLAMTFFANSAGNDTFSTLLLSYIVDVAAGDPRWLNVSSVCTFRVERKGRTRSTQNVAPPNDTFSYAADKAGTYRDPLFGEVTITREGETLNATYGRVTGKVWKTWDFGGHFGPEKFGISFYNGSRKGSRYVHIYGLTGLDGYMAFLKTANERNEKRK